MKIEKPSAVERSYVPAIRGVPFAAYICSRSRWGGSSSVGTFQCSLADGIDGARLKHSYALSSQVGGTGLLPFVTLMVNSPASDIVRVVWLSYVCFHGDIISKLWWQAPWFIVINVFVN